VVSEATARKMLSLDDWQDHVSSLPDMLDGLRIPSNELFALLIAVSFAAGLNVYAAVATLGLLAHTGVFTLPPALQVLSSWIVIGCAGILFLVELFADKIPVFDLLWNALHTFVRVPVAALLAYGATGQLSPGWQLFVTVLGGGVALAAHGGKTAVRAAVTPYPEPFSNVMLSLGEDALSIFLTWFATRHPYWAAAIALALVLVVVILLHWVVGAFLSALRRARKELDLIFDGV
jgi:hypothetical protein